MQARGVALDHGVDVRLDGAKPPPEQGRRGERGVEQALDSPSYGSFDVPRSRSCLNEMLIVSLSVLPLSSILNRINDRFDLTRRGDRAQPRGQAEDTTEQIFAAVPHQTPDGSKQLGDFMSHWTHTSPGPFRESWRQPSSALRSRSRQ